MNSIKDMVQSQYLRMIKNIIANGDENSFVIVRRSKNIDFMRNYGLTTNDIRRIILDLTLSDCIGGQEEDRDSKYGGWIFKFSPLYKNIKLYMKLRLETRNNIICISIHEFGLCEEDD